MESMSCIMCGICGLSFILHRPDCNIGLQIRLSSKLQTPGILVTDSRNFFDKLWKDTPIIKGAERRADIEALTVKESMSSTGLMLRWVHSDAQLANSNTKPSEKHQIHLFQKLQSHWRIVYDPEIMSARRRKTAGLQPMADSNFVSRVHH